MLTMNILAVKEGVFSIFQIILNSCSSGSKNASFEGFQFNQNRLELRI